MGTLRCDVPARVQRAEASVKQDTNLLGGCAAGRGADGAARRLYPFILDYFAFGKAPSPA